MLSAWWRRHARAGSGRPARAAPAPATPGGGRPPALECLEDRCLLATGLSLPSAGGVTLFELANQPFTAPVAHVRLAAAPDVRVAIDWGDGQTSAGTLRSGGGVDFDVLGTATYHRPGSFAVRVFVTGDDGTALAVTSQAVVGEFVGSLTFAVEGAPGWFTAGDGQLVVFRDGSVWTVPAAGGKDGQAGPQPATTPAAPAPPGKATPPAGPAGMGAHLAGAGAADPGPAAVVAPAGLTPPRPVDPTTFFVWTSQRDQEGTVPRPEPSPAPESMTGPHGLAAPARLDLETYFVAHQAAQAAAPLPPAGAREGAVRPAAMPGGLGEWMRNDAVMAALADAAGAPPAAAPPAAAALVADAGPGAAAEEPEREPGEASTERGRSLPWGGTGWLVVTGFVYGLWGARTGPGQSRRGPARRSPADGDGCPGPEEG